MTQEHLVLLLPLGGYAGWWLGGRGWILGKAWRREVWPLYAAIIAIISGLSWWWAAMGAVLMDVAARLPYGEHSPIWQRGLTALVLGACLLPFGWTWTWVIVPVVFSVSYAASLRWNRWTWAWTESLTGLSQGIVLVLVLSKRG